MERILFIFTFIFGVASLLTWTKLFSKEISGFFDTLIPVKPNFIFRYFDVLIFLFSLGYQINYWLF